MAQVQSDDEIAVFVGDANTHHSELLESVSPTDQHGGDALDLCNLLDCEQLFTVPLALLVKDLNL